VITLFRIAAGVARLGDRAGRDVDQRARVGIDTDGWHPR
jgi:hypothetical protein